MAAVPWWCTMILPLKRIIFSLGPAGWNLFLCGLYFSSEKHGLHLVAVSPHLVMRKGDASVTSIQLTPDFPSALSS